MCLESMWEDVQYCDYFSTVLRYFASFPAVQSICYKSLKVEALVKELKVAGYQDNSIGKDAQLASVIDFKSCVWRLEVGAVE